MRFVALLPIIIAGIVIAGMTACSSDQAPTRTWWINSFKVPCVGVAPMSCLQFHEGEEPLGEWQLLYQGIVGFDYEPGSLYRVKVRVIDLSMDRGPMEQLPADASSLRYELLEVMEQVPDPRAPLHDIYVLEAMDSGDAGTGRAHATVEFDIVQGRYAGQDACRSFEGPILVVDGERLQLGPASASKDECPDDPLAHALLDELARTASWRRDGMRLELLDSQGERHLLFRKVD